MPMIVREQIKEHLSTHAEPKRSEMQQLHELILGINPASKLWYLDGKNEDGKVVSNPNIGYGSYEIEYADGSTKEFYQVGLSANTSGISVYIMGIADKKYLAETFGSDIGKAKVTGYCISFRKLSDINLDTLMAAIRLGLVARK